jgi:hypothetical protein
MRVTQANRAGPAIPASAVRGHVIMADRPSDLREWVIAAWGAVCLRV